MLSGKVLGPAGTATLLDMNPVAPPPLPSRYFGLGAVAHCLESTCASGTTVLVHTNTNDPTPEQLIQLPIAMLGELGVV